MPRANVKPLSYHQRALNVLADGRWHTFRDIHKAIARFIDPEAADREYRKRHRSWEQVKRADRVAQGKKRLVFLSLNSAMHHRKLVEAQGRDWERQYRLTRVALRARGVTSPARKAGGRPTESAPPEAAHE